jgi:hypothetical protein
MRLDIRFSNRPLEDLWCQAVTALVFQTPSITEGVFFNLNRKMTGALENILRRDAWTGDRGEKLLIATQNMIRADKLLFHGLGTGSEFKVAILEEEVYSLGMTLDKMGVSDFGIYVPVVKGLEGQYGYHLELSTSNLVKTFYKRHGKDPDFILKIIFSVEKDFLDILDSVVTRLRKHLQPIRDFTIIIDPLCKGRDTENINPSEGTERNKGVS